MSELKICRICLRTEAKVYHFDLFQLKCYYEEVMSLKVNNMDGLPQCFCYECATILHKFHMFKEKCYIGQRVLRDILWKEPISYEAIYKTDRISYNLQSPLQKLNHKEQINIYPQHNVNYENIDNMDDNYYSDSSINNDSFVKIEESHTINNPMTEAPKTLITTDNTLSFESKKVHDTEVSTKQENKSDWPQDKIALDPKYWKKHNLSEEEALTQFRARAEEQKYLMAAFKCKDCFRGFSKRDMLGRHLQLRHSQNIGRFECRFCRMRFKWSCHLRQHMRTHYTKYECLRCCVICPLQNTALFHEEYHRGITRKCDHCEEVFRHKSTYYTHLRTHRSEHVCASCGASFVSAAGLRQHARLKHVDNEFDTADDEDDIVTYCQSCDIRFETRRAYDEHLFHSTKHTFEVEFCNENSKGRKILSKKEQAKIKTQMRKRQPEEATLKAPAKRKRRMRRLHRKPTTCHQCGEHFSTQAACHKHHLAAHPGTSFFAPSERHICELCGASLAPGSVAAHKNMHSRELVHACGTCGRQFHSHVGLKRHLVTHTGEKKFACPLCSKRFTQSNSMKLHYRTFHLKQPYPKRNRRKKTEEERQSPGEVEPSHSESDSMPEEPLKRIEPAPMDSAPEDQENLHYLTLN